MGINFYDQHYYKNLRGNLPEKEPHPGQRRQIRFFKQILCPKENEKLLDLGCGTGDYLSALSDSKADLWGIDISELATAVAKKKVIRPNQILCADALPLPFESNTFDHVTAWGVIEHFPNIPKIIGEIRRVLKADGTSAIMVPNYYYFQFIWDTIRKGSGPVKHQEVETLYSFAEWRTVIEKEGLKIVNVNSHNKFNKSPAAIWLRNKLIPFYLSNHFIFICKKN